MERKTEASRYSLEERDLICESSQVGRSERKDEHGSKFLCWLFREDAASLNARERRPWRSIS